MNFILKKVLHPVQSGRYHRDFSHLVSPVWAAVPLPVPGKMLNTPQIIRTMILNKLACFPVGNRFYWIQHNNQLNTLAHLYPSRDQFPNLLTLKLQRQILKRSPLSFQLSRLRHHISECFVSAVRGFDLHGACFDFDEGKFVTPGDLLFVASLTSCHAMNSTTLEC